MNVLYEVCNPEIFSNWNCVKRVQIAKHDDSVFNGRILVQTTRLSRRYLAFQLQHHANSYNKITINPGYCEIRNFCELLTTNNLVTLEMHPSLHISGEVCTLLPEPISKILPEKTQGKIYQPKSFDEIRLLLNLDFDVEISAHPDLKNTLDYKQVETDTSEYWFRLKNGDYAFFGKNIDYGRDFISGRKYRVVHQRVHENYIN